MNGVAKAILYHVKEMFRIRHVIFWLLLFPVILSIIYGAVYRGSPELKGDVYLAVPQDNGLVTQLRNVLTSLGLSVHVINASKTSNPVALVRERLLSSLSTRPIAVVTVSRGLANTSALKRNVGHHSVVVTVYTTSEILGGVVTQAVMSTIYEMATGWTLHVVPKIKIVGTQAGVAEAFIVMALFTAMYSMTSVLGEVGGFYGTQINKLMAISPKGSRYFKATVFSAPLISYIVSLFVIGLVMSIVFNADISKALSNPYFWLAVFSTYLLAYGLACIIATLLVKLSRDVEQIHRSLEAVGPSVPLILAFISGYFVPQELLPTFMRSLAKLLPPYYSLQLASWSVKLGLHPLYIVCCAFVPSLVLACVGSIILPVVKKL